MTKFALRGVGQRGARPVSARLCDPTAVPGLEFMPEVDAGAAPDLPPEPGLPPPLAWLPLCAWQRPVTAGRGMLLHLRLVGFLPWGGRWQGPATMQDARQAR